MDAHAHDELNCPLLIELQAILDHPIKGNIILIDDVYFIETAQKNPERAPWATELSFEEVTNLIDQLSAHGTSKKFEYKLHRATNYLLTITQDEDII